MAVDIKKYISEARALNKQELKELIDSLESLGEEANGNSPEYRLLKEAIDLLENPPPLKDGVEVILKCNHPKGKVDDEVTLPPKEAKRLLDMAWAIKA